jgi:hypothetical protein
MMMMMMMMMMTTMGKHKPEQELAVAFVQSISTTTLQYMYTPHTQVLRMDCTCCTHTPVYGSILY